jgi:pimeloyl-ACP methyl ester carboxylesterase
MFVDVQGAGIHYSATGKGAPVLFLHGIPDSGAVWNAVAGTLASSYHCIVPDLPGFGRSAVPAGFGFGLDEMAQFVDGFLAAAGVDAPVHLVVHDVGGPYGLAWAVRHPHKVASIAIMNTVFQAEYSWHRYGRICRKPVLGELIQLLTTQSGLARAMHQNAGTVKPDRAHVAATYRAFTGLARMTTLRLYRALDPAVFQGWDVALRTLAAAVPSLVLWGDRDTYIGSRFAERFGARQVMHFPDCGHWPMVEMPDLVARQLLAHLASAAPRYGEQAAPDKLAERTVY